MQIRYKTILVWFSLLTLFAWPAEALAESTVTISPPFQQITIQPNTTETSFEYSVTNNDPTQTKTFELSATDFGNLNESGGVAFLGSNPKRKYGLANWLSFGTALIEVKPRQTYLITVKVLNRSDLSPGGHYGAIFLTQQIPPTSDNSPVTIKPVLSTLLFAQKLGGEIYNLKLDKVLTNNKWWQDFNLQLRFVNNGNIDVVPRGIVHLYDPKGRQIGQAVINEGSTRILPDSFRRYPVQLISAHSTQLPGKYTLKIQYRYDGQAQFTTYTQSFYYFSFWGIALPLGALIVLIIIASLILRRIRKRKV